MSDLTEILDTTRTYLGDFNETRYVDAVIKKALRAALYTVSADIGSDYSYNDGTATITPSLTNIVKHLVATCTSVVLILGEETASALETGGLSWKSGMASINFAGYHKSISESAKKLSAHYNRLLEAYKLNNADFTDIDLYQVTNTDITSIN